MGCAILLLASTTLCMQPFSQPTVDEIEKSKIPSLQILAMQKVTPQLYAALVDLIDTNKDITTTTNPILQHAQLQTLPIFTQALIREINKHDLLDRATKNNCHVQTLKFVSQQREDIDLQDAGGNTHLQRAISNGDYQTTKFLLESYADFDIQDSYLNTPLILAIAQGHYEIVELLLLFKADPDKTSQTHIRPLEIAIFKRHNEIIKLLQQYGASDLDKDIPYKIENHDGIFCRIYPNGYFKELVKLRRSRMRYCTIS